MNETASQAKDVRYLRAKWAIWSAGVLVVVLLLFVAALPFVQNYRTIKWLQRLDAKVYTDLELRHSLGFAWLEQFENIVYINLNGASTNDSDLTRLGNLLKLEVLYLGKTDVTDADLAHLARLSNLTKLGLSETKVSDAGLRHLKGMRNLQSLHLDQTDITDAGLAHLAGLSNLKTLRLSYTKITDASLVHLKQMKKMKTLSLDRTAITSAGIKELEATLPNCDINWFEPE